MCEGRRLTLPAEYAIRLRRYATPTTKAEVIRHTDLSWQVTKEQGATFNLTVSTLVAGQLGEPFYAAVEVRTASGEWVSPRHDLFTFHEEDRDEKDRAGIRSFTGVLYVADRAGHHLIGPSMTADGSITWLNTTAGVVVADLLTRISGHGITRSFTASADSDGRPWPTADKTDHTASEFASIGSVVGNLTSGAYCDWYARGTELVLLLPGTGTDRTQTIKLGPRADSAPVKTSTTETASKFYVVSDQEGVPVQIVNRPELGAGPREAVVTVSGATTAAAALRMATPIIDRASQKRREVSLSYQASELPAFPFVDFELGDDFLVAGDRYRLVGVQVTRGGSGTTVRLTFGEILLDLVAKLAARAAQISFGSVSMTGGSGQPITPGVVKPNAEPAAPVAVSVVNNVGGVRPDGSSFAAVRLEWPAVTKTVYGADTHVTQYEVWERVGDTSAVPIASVPVPAFEVEWPIVERYVTVRAYNGRWSAFSEEIHVVPLAPVQVTAGLSMPLLESAFGIVTVTWDGTNILGPVGPEFNRGYVEVAAAAAGPWERYGAGFHAEGQVAVLRGTAGLDMFVRFAWVDTLGRTANLSSVSQITVVGLVPEDLDSIPDFFANAAVIERARIGLLQAGVIEVDMLAPNVGELINIEANEGLLVVTGRVEDLEQAGQYYRFGSEGAIIGRVDDPVTFNFRNDGASFDVNGVPATTWGPAGMDAPRLTSDEAVIGNLLFEKSGNRTVVRVVQS